ncbi:hypothetical protein GSI_13169 [Ganoderma sinense ZZ0214-1]|uniref:Uncharacterized protein n=1 Tax=Ganoderma sinense ZZ0214-1 TaxID=1077348 RepID=A0A2G8RUU1_9APHY|nr:hypothetical protein GSI_13169 [Ganoderma sinense ZZ0214-1]
MRVLRRPPEFDLRVFDVGYKGKFEAVLPIPRAPAFRWFPSPDKLIEGAVTLSAVAVASPSSVHNELETNNITNIVASTVAVAAAASE